MSFIQEVEKAEKWLDENESKLKLLGENGEKIINGLRGMLNGGQVGVLAQITGFSDVDKILTEAGGVDVAIKKGLGIDLDGLTSTALTIVKSLLLAVSLFGG